MTISNSNNSGSKRVKLSYSSMNTLQSCEQKYSYYKVTEEKNDPDYEESDALGLGKAFHQVLELTKHTDYNDSLLIAAMEEHKVDSSDRDLLSMMLSKYIEFRKKSGFKVVYCELALETSEFRGFIDFIAVRGNEWFIGDLKTAGTHSESILSRLPLDPQINLYAHFAEEIQNSAGIKELEGKEFAGCLYTQVIKSKATTPKGLEAGVKVIEMVVPVSVMNPDLIWALFKEAHDRASQIHQGEAPRKNFNSCMAYFSPCQYFSKCHGKTFTDNKQKVKVVTINTLNEIGDLL